MTTLYWTVSPGAENIVKLELEGMGRACVHAGHATGLDILSLPDPSPELVHRTLGMLGDDFLRSAALVVHPFDEDTIWVASEWWHRFLIEDSLLENTALVIDQDLESAQAGNRIFAVLRAFKKERPAREPHALDPKHWGRGEALDQTTVLANPARYFGDYMDPLVGGASALFAAGQEAARRRGSPDRKSVV